MGAGRQELFTDARQPMHNDRDPARVRFHYEVEKELAERLKQAPAGERLGLYGPLYDELFRRVTDHPQTLQKSSGESKRRATLEQLALIRPLLGDASCQFLEIGAGDCALSVAVAPFVESVKAIDVSKTITQSDTLPKNVSLILSDGINIPVPDNSIDLAYSNQLMEHLHPDDALAQLRNIFAALKPGGTYVCITPNRVSGPHDVSRGFTSTASGFHLKEYTMRELRSIMREAGFTSFSQSGLIKGKPVRYPLGLALAVEAALLSAPNSLAQSLTQRLPLRLIYQNIYFLAQKPANRQPKHGDAEANTLRAPLHKAELKAK